MTALLKGLRIVEAASFIAAPSCGLHCAQLGAEVIRIDAIGGGPDRNRWPQAADGESLYWQGLNKGKKSVAIDLRQPEGRELAQRLATAPGESAGLFVTNFPPDGFLSHDRLAALRPDIVTLRIMGWRDGTAAVDYTVNAAMGIPLMTGPADLPADEPVNSVLPTWDLMAGAYGAFSLLAAHHARRETGIGREIRLPLGDLAATTLGHLGQLAEVLLSGVDRPRQGNDLFGAFGRDFATADGRRLMIVAITTRQWRDLVTTLGLTEEIAALERSLGTSFASDEGERYRHREALYPLFEAAIGARSEADLTALFEGTGVCWAPYRSVHEAATATDRFAVQTDAMPTVAHPGGHAYPTPGAAASFPGADPQPTGTAPRFGGDTEAVLADVLGLGEGEIGLLNDTGIIAL
ncbi:CoA transferase [Bauldia litoralis]|uniref:2-methylfumaryl-CoA isomerase n=1 Tax=Bauldia litoralis TaxID=665467 RepID=A0A1G6BNJ2_9HYPH|nr:CoA transferase [Bauldia litoralis]SDB22148.1 2-methylfumaryl-CoA isomerase [Bauldia litoralis]